MRDVMYGCDGLWQGLVNAGGARGSAVAARLEIALKKKTGETRRAPALHATYDNTTYAHYKLCVAGLNVL